MYVPIPDGNWSEGLPVEFTKDDGTKWVANIEYGKEGFDYITELSNSTEILVISNGWCHIIDRNKEKSITDFGYDFKQVVKNKEQFILIGNRDVSIVESSDKIKTFDNLCLDFIDNIKLENQVLSGTLNDFNAWGKYTQTEFNIDLKTYELTEIKKKAKPKQKTEREPTELKKWWEIWK